MKLKNFLLITATFVMVVSFSACKKDKENNASSELETTFEISGDQALSDNLNSDAQDVLNEAAIDNNFSGNTPATATSTLNLLSCATVTVTPLQGFPKILVLTLVQGALQLTV